MPISLTIQAYRGVAPASPLARRFDRAGGIVGRAPGNDLVLDDPTKYISRAHARVEWRDGGWFLIDMGGNPSIVNGQALGPAGEVRLRGGERIDIGDYTLSATVEPEPAQDPQPNPQRDPQSAPEQAPSPGWGGGVEAPLPAAFTADMPLFGQAVDSLASAGSVNVDGLFAATWDPRSDPLGLNLPLAPARFPAPSSAPSSAPSLAPAYRGAESDHAPPEQAAFVMPRPAASAAPAIPHDYDPLADLLPAGVPAPAPPALRQSPEPEADTVRPAEPPRKPAPSLLPPEPAPAKPPAAATAPGDDGRVLQALLRGLKLPDLHTRRDAEELAELAGTMLREATAGTIDALRARTLTKRESRVEMTMMAPEANNPLKFFPDAGSALTHMLQGPLPGYLPPQRAFAGAFVDLRAHELAVMAGTRAALAGVLRRFDPAALEERLRDPGMLDKVFTASRKARLWDRMVELYGQMALEADEDFQRLFGEAFAVAYEEQVRRLRDACS